MEPRYYSRTRLPNNKVGDVVLQIEENPKIYTSKQPLICKGFLMGVALLLVIVDTAFISPFSCAVPSADLYNATKQECSFSIVPLAFVLLVEIAQIITMIPSCSAALIFVFRVLQLSGIFGLKILIQSYEKVTNTNNVSPGYVGYAILCGIITASFAVDMPDDNQRTKIVFASTIGAFTAVTMGVEFAFNEYQTINGTDFWIDMSLTIPVVVLVVIIYAVLHKLKKLESNFSFGCFIIAFVPLMYLLVPTTHFNNMTTQVLIVVTGVIVYMCTSVYLMMQT